MALRITPTLLSEYQMTCTENEGKQLSTEKSLEINDDLIIEFNNSAQQVRIAFIFSLKSYF